MPADPAPAVQPAPATDATQATSTDTSASVQSDATAADTSASTAPTTTTTKQVGRRAVVKAAAPATRVATSTPAARSVKTAAIPAPVRTTVAAAPAAAPVSKRPAPIVDLNAKQPLATPAVAAKPARKKDPTLPIAGGALAFLAIGGAAAAMTRRRHDDEEEEWAGEEAANAEPVDAAKTDEPPVHEEQPAIVAPSAIAWEPASVETNADSEGREGETYVERAYRGPTPDNPSLSLRKRLKRAAFMDKRERDVAAGRAKPVDATAGLPDRMVEEQSERELDRS